MEWLGIVAVLCLAMGFNYTNGFHDAANAIATSVSTRALTPRAALVLAAIGNLAGSFFGAKVAETVGKGIIRLPNGTASLVVVGAALIGAIAWNLITWYFGLPSSSSHALIGGMVGAAMVAGASVLWHGVLTKVVIPMVLSPIVGLLVGYAVMLAIMWLFRHSNPGRLNRGFRIAQTCSAAGMAFGHGLQDAAKTMGIVVLALTLSGNHTGTGIPLWVFFLTAGVLSLGTYNGGWRIMRTLGRKVIELDPPQGFAAETTASAVLYVAAIGYGAPISTTHTITSAIMGVGATRRLSAVRWGVAGNIVLAWVLTFPAAAAVAIAGYGLIRLFS